MRLRTLLMFTAPSAVLMLVFIFVPLVSVAVQSLFSTTLVREQVRVETCTPGFLAQVCTTTERSQVVLGADGKPVTRTVFTGLDSYRSVLEVEKLAAAFAPGGQGWTAVAGLDFWRALRFTLTFTFITLPLVVGLGMLIALAVNNMLRSVRGPLVFVSLLPFIVTPVIGALSIRWLFVGDGILTALLRATIDPSISMFAQGWTIELLMLVYRIWHVAPFAFSPSPPCSPIWTGSSSTSWSIPYARPWALPIPSSACCRAWRSSCSTPGCKRWIRTRWNRR